MAWASSAACKLVGKDKAAKMAIARGFVIIFFMVMRSGGIGSILYNFMQKLKLLFLASDSRWQGIIQERTRYDKKT